MSRVGCAATLAGVLVALGTTPARAQGGFDVDPATDGIIAATSWGAFLGMTLGVPKTPPAARCVREACGPLGDGARPYNATWDVISYVPVTLAMGGALAPSVGRWASSDGTGREVADSSLMLAQALGLTFAATEIVKIAVPRARPFVAFASSVDAPSRIAPDASASFWSGHASAAFAAAAIGSLDACRAGGPLGCEAPAIGLHTLAVSTALMRVLAGKHHVSDVVVGAAVGSAIGGVVALAHAPNAKPSPAAGHAMLGGQAAMLSMMWLW